MSTDFQHQIKEIVALFEGPFSRDDGLPHYDVHGLTGQPLSDRSLFCELADYLPLLAKAGARQYTNRQLEIILPGLTISTPLFRNPQTRRFTGTRIRLPVVRTLEYCDSLDYTEILYGLLDLYVLLGDTDLLKTAEHTLRVVYQFFHRQGFIASWYVHKLNLAVPLFESLNGMFVEILVELFRLTDDEDYLAMASSLARKWLELPFFKKQGIFPSIHCPQNSLKVFPRIRRTLRRAELAKYNSSMAYGLLALCREDPSGGWLDYLEIWLRGLHDHFQNRPGVYYHLSMDSELPDGYSDRPILSTNFVFLDIITELYQLTKNNEYLEMARAGADFWLEQQAPETGLFPDRVGQDRSFLDGNTDLIMSLMRISELTGDTKYRQAGLTCLKGILHYFKTKFGFVRDVHLRSGKHANETVETRYVSLLLKPLLLIHENWTMFGDDNYAALLKDR